MDNKKERAKALKGYRDKLWSIVAYNMLFDFPNPYRLTVKQVRGKHRHYAYTLPFDSWVEIFEELIKTGHIKMTDDRRIDDRLIRKRPVRRVGLLNRRRT